MNRRNIAALAILGIAVVGFHADVAVAQTGACCNAGNCTEESEGTCTSGGGYYAGDGTDCVGTDCTVEACCNGGNCTDVSVAQCTAEA
ncbi:MAG: hypothetical protein O7F76_06265, partial [Planctomycetota bacterium]|nr:hypothetical protein [Planctomycetota bacterium]